MKQEHLVKLFMTNGGEKSMHIKKWQSNDEFVDPYIVISDNREPHLLEVTHGNLNTVVVLTQLVPWIVLTFNEDDEIWGTHLSLNANKASFAIQTQARKMLFVPWPVDFSPADVIGLRC